tara:strand:+ start:2170 stop:2412 length:243 start_codon:yes stop_codon:yes gene_type:complete
MSIKKASHRWEFNVPKKEKDRVLKILDSSVDREIQWDTDMAAIGLGRRKLEAKLKCQERREKRDQINEVKKSLEESTTNR